MPPESPGPEPAEKHSVAESPGRALEIAHVLFMDIVGYSKQPMERQTDLLKKLQDQVTRTAAYRRASLESQLISLPTGDGMALVFFHDPLAPVECAVELSKSLRQQPEIHLRMGIHTGGVYRIADINASSNVSGEGINMAQRVMDCGDAGHILLSRSVADLLSHLQQWAPYLTDLGEQEVKHGVRIQIYNLCTDEAGNREIPHKVAAQPKPRTSTTSPERKTKLVSGAAIVALLVIAMAAWFFWHGSSTELAHGPAASAATTAALPSRSFNYSIQVQRYRDGKPYKDPFVLPGEMIFEKDYRIRLQITSAQPGYLYILNQGPATPIGGFGGAGDAGGSGGAGGGGGGGGAGGGGGGGGGAMVAVPSYNILFPGSGMPATVHSAQVVNVPPDDKDWIVFDEQEGIEQLWLVWSDKSLPVFESAKTFGDAKNRGAIKDVGLLLQIEQFLDQQGSDSNTVRDDGNQKTIVSGSGNVIVKLLKLEHH